MATFRRREDAQFFGRRLDGSVVKQAVTVLGMYLVLFYGGALAISTLEGLPMSACLYETASAVATVGLTLGIAPTLGAASQLSLDRIDVLGTRGRPDLDLCCVQQQARCVPACRRKGFDGGLRISAALSAAIVIKAPLRGEREIKP